MRFRVWEEGDEDNATTIEAVDHGEAAEKWAEEDDWSSAEYSICGKGREPIVFVREEAGGTTRKFRVSGECVPQLAM